MLRRPCISACLALLLAGGTARAQPPADPWTGFTAVTAPFRSARFQYFQQGTPEEGGRVARQGELQGYLLTPTPAQGRLPAVVLLHGCAGLSPNTAQSLRDWARWLAQNGIASLILDSFGPRSVRATCGDPDGHWSQRRVDDVHVAAGLLARRGDIDRGRIYVLGQSNGGRTALNTASASEVNRPLRVAGAVALYPWCGDDARTEFDRPLLLVLAGRERFNPAELCQRLERTDRRMLAPRIITLADATHSFDANAPARPSATTDSARGRVEDVLEYNPAGLARTREEVLRMIRGTAGR